MTELNTKPAHNDRGTISMSKKGTRRDGRKAATTNAFDGRCAFRLRFRAIKWRRSSDDITVVGPWELTREDALKNAYADFAPHARAIYEIEDSRGAREELTDDDYDVAHDWYHESIEARDACGVWG